MKKRLLAGVVGAVAAGLMLSMHAPPAHSETELVGQFQLIVAESPDGAKYVPFVSSNGKLYRLEGDGKYNFKDRQRVAVTGTTRGRTIDVVKIRSVGKAPAQPAAPTSMNALVQLVNWTAPDSVTPAQAEQQYAITNAAWFDNESYGSLALTADATNWLTIAAPPDADGAGPDTPCDNISVIQSEGDQAATAAGWNLAAYSNIVYYYPSCPNERWGGWGEQPGNRTWLIGEMSTRVGVHELGHNLGLGHSRSDLCTAPNGSTVPYSSSCTVEEYGDPTSAMGAGFSGQGMFAASQQAYLAWLGSGTHGVQNVTSSGSFSLAPLESRVGGTQALTVVDDAGKSFWIEYRQPTANDAFLWSGSTNGVLIRSGDNSSDLFDMTPGTAGTFTDAALPSGSSWSSPAGGLTVSVTSATSSSAAVNITIGTIGLPGKPVIKKASSGSKRDRVVSVTGRWDKPRTGGLVDKYYVTAVRKSNGAKKRVVVSSTARSTKITGLKRNAKYVVRVLAYNAAGNGPTSKSSNTVKAR